MGSPNVKRGIHCKLSVNLVQMSGAGNALAQEMSMTVLLASIHAFTGRYHAKNQPRGADDKVRLGY